MDFGLLPPEVNSSRMYAGPGSASMMVAATAWDGVAAVLNSAATSYASVIAGLAVESWLGPASASMAAAATPYAVWLSAAAVRAEQTAMQARSAATAFETAFAMTVPPPLITANRSQLMSLVATNLLGHNSPAIEAIQAEYAEMWAQDAAAMYGYSGASEAASTLTPFGQPAQAADPAGPAAQAAQAAQAGASQATQDAETSALAAAGQLAEGLASPTSAAAVPSAAAVQPAATIAIPTPIGDLDVVAMYIAAISSVSLGLAGVNSARPWIFGYGSGTAGTDAGGMEPTEDNFIGAVTTASSTGWGGEPASAGVGEAALVGALTVPHSWTMAAPEIRLAVEALPSNSFAAPPMDLGGAPAGLLSGMALASLAGRGVAGTSNRSDNSPAPADEDQSKRKPTVVVIQKPPPPEGLGNRQ